MKAFDDYRQEKVAEQVLQEIRRTVTRPWVLMEACGGQTHSILQHRLDRLLPPEVELVHGPGCPVCVTSLEMLDKAHRLAQRPEVIFCSFGNMLRAPGSEADLLLLQSRGADVRVVDSPLDCLKLARANPARKVVFFAVGFETTAPANAMAVWQARRQGITNFFLLVSQVLVPPMLTSILQSPLNRVQGFLGPGRVCAVMGYREYESIAQRYRVPIVITGLEPLDLLEGTLMVLRQLEAGMARVENQYARIVKRDGNTIARRLVHEVFQVSDRRWRGVGPIPKSGLKLRYEFRDFDAERLFDLGTIATQESSGCVSGLVLRGAMKPHQCPAFGRDCTPGHPLGATMVSSEGACAAYYTYGRHLDPQPMELAEP